SLAAAIFAFANVAGTWTNGPCCVNVANSGTGTDTINKTVAGTSRGDALINSVCTGWKGTAPGTPGPDPNNDPEMVPRTFQTVASAGLQHFTGTSPGPLVERPMTSYRHLRWLQSGSRSWTIVGLGLLATTDAPDAAAPPPMPDAAAPPAPDAAATAPDTTAPPPPDAGAPLPPDITPAPALDAAAPPADLAPAPPAARDGGAEPDLESEPDADPGQRQIALQVGCACRLGSAPPGSALPLVLLLPLLLRRRR
ncbi:MAG TPA: MYXO-CTERM sorting domain-containing protein, partial [Polyangia bacterium]|nr:MYXO-CTERM sorting domain-containing protein [Polyangia bacterium]